MDEETLFYDLKFPSHIGSRSTLMGNLSTAGEMFGFHPTLVLAQRAITFGKIHFQPRFHPTLVLAQLEEILENI